MSAWNRWQDWTNVVLGAWLIIAPFILGTSSDRNSTWNAVAVGVLVAVIALWALAMPLVWLAEYLNALLGAWLIVSPFVLGLGGLATAAWNAWIVGICVLGLALWALLSTRRARVDTGAQVAGIR
jgi:hypothetical protein